MTEKLKQLKRALKAEVEAAVEASPTESPSEIVAALLQRHSKISGADGELALLCLQSGLKRRVRKALKAKRKAAKVRALGEAYAAVKRSKPERMLAALLSSRPGS